MKISLNLDVRGWYSDQRLHVTVALEDDDGVEISTATDWVSLPAIDSDRNLCQCGCRS